MKKLFILTIAALISASVHGRTLHYGDYSVELTATKNTTPALHVQTADQTWYGAMFDATDAPAHSLHITHGGNEYFVGKWCDAGTYLPAGGVNCITCDIGYYCIGGKHHAPCTGGAIACGGTGHTMDVPTNLFNRLLTLEEVNKYIPATDISQWTYVAACYHETPECEYDIMDYTDAARDRRRNDPVCSCWLGTLAPGTYLFIQNWYEERKRAQIIILDHTVGFALQESMGVYEVLIDTEHETYESYTIKTPFYSVDGNDTNVRGVTDLPTKIYIYKLN